MRYSNKKPALQRVVKVQNLKMDFSSASISSARFFTFSRYAGVKTSLADRCSSFTTTERRELFKSVSIRWMLLRSWLLKSSLAMFASLTGEFWLGLPSCANTIAARLRYSSKKAKAFKLGHYPKLSPLELSDLRDRIRAKYWDWRRDKSFAGDVWVIPQVFCDVGAAYVFPGIFAEGPWIVYHPALRHAYRIGIL